MVDFVGLCSTVVLKCANCVVTKIRRTTDGKQYTIVFSSIIPIPHRNILSKTLKTPSGKLLKSS